MTVDADANDYADEVILECFGDEKEKTNRLNDLDFASY